MKFKYISINILENLIKETKLITVKNLCRKAMFNIIMNEKENLGSDYIKQKLFKLYENDKLHKFIKD